MKKFKLPPMFSTYSPYFYAAKEKENQEDNRIILLMSSAYLSSTSFVLCLKTILQTFQTL